MNDPKFSVTNIGSKIGAQAVGDHSRATGHVTDGGESNAHSPQQEQFNQDVSEILHALTDAKERLASEQAEFIRLISGLLDVQVEGKTSDEVRAEIRQVLEARNSKLPLSKLREKLSSLAMGMASNGAYQLLQTALA